MLMEGQMDARTDEQTENWIPISYLCDRVSSIFSHAGKFCLVHGLRQLTHNSNSNVKVSVVPSFMPFHKKH